MNNQHLLGEGLCKLDCKLIVLTETLTVHHAIMRDLSRTYQAHELESDFVILTIIIIIIIIIIIMRGFGAGLTSRQSHTSSSPPEPSCRWWTPHMTSTTLPASPTM